MAGKRESSAEALEAFDALGVELANRAEVEAARWFGIPALKTSGKVFAALNGDSIVVKVGAVEVDRLIAAGGGERFDPSGKDRGMKDWLESPAPEAEWSALAEAALEFAATST